MVQQTRKRRHVMADKLKGARHILVTGGSGFVGRAVVTELIRRGHRVTATTHPLEPSLEPERDVDWVQWDALQESLPDVDWGDVDTVLHLAKPANHFDFPKGAPAMYELGVAVPFRLLDKAYHVGLRRVAIACTGDVIGATDKPIGEEDVCYQPLSFYGASKACGEIIARAYLNVVQTAILRFFHPYGPHGERVLVNRLVHKVLNGDVVEIEGSEGVSLNPVWVEDLARGVALAIESSETGVFNLAGPECVTLRALLELIGKAVGRPPLIRCLPKPVLTNHVGRYERSAALLGYHPEVSLAEGLQRVVRDMLKGA